MADRIPIMADGLPEIFHEALGERFEVLDWDASEDCDAVARSVAMLSYAHPLADGELMDRMPQLKVISNHGVGVDHIDLNAAEERGIPVLSDEIYSRLLYSSDHVSILGLEGMRERTILLDGFSKTFSSSSVAS